MNDYKFNSGPLRSAITIELHTHKATQLWYGRKGSREKNIHPIIGMTRFLMILNTIKMDAARDNPYADVFMLLIEERLLDARKEMNVLKEQADIIFKDIPETITIENCMSIQPAKFPLYVNSQLGFIAVYLLTDIDEFVRKMYLANHMAVITYPQLKDYLHRGLNLIRSIYVLVQKYQRVPVTRRDFTENNGIANEAIKRYGVIPKDILEGSRRSQFAPAIIGTMDESTISESAENEQPEEQEPDSFIDKSLAAGEPIVKVDDDE